MREGIQPMGLQYRLNNDMLSNLIYKSFYNIRLCVFSLKFFISTFDKKYQNNSLFSYENIPFSSSFLDHKIDTNIHHTNSFLACYFLQNCMKTKLNIILSDQKVFSLMVTRKK